jgi:thiamine biosynthesis lipoprotein
MITTLQASVNLSAPADTIGDGLVSMGGRLNIYLQAPQTESEPSTGEALKTETLKLISRVLQRVNRWAAYLTRYNTDSDLSLLNADLRTEILLRPTITAAFEVAREAARLSGGLVDITLLDARLSAEGRGEPANFTEGRVWQLERLARGVGLIHRPVGLHFDLDGIGKGWLADRALNLLAGHSGALVDADGDLAVRCGPGQVWEIGVDDPRSPETNLAILRLGSSAGLTSNYGVATSGTSIHHWQLAGHTTHHLIDPATGRSAQTDVVQATVIAGSALRAEALAKAAVIAGSFDGFGLLEKAHPYGAILLTAAGEVLALPQTLTLLAA